MRERETKDAYVVEAAVKLIGISVYILSKR